jgi:micrococcal nuclease
VYVDTIFVNAWLLENGFAKVMTVPPNVKYASLFRELQRKAEAGKVGFWGEGYDK